MSSLGALGATDLTVGWPPGLVPVSAPPLPPPLPLPEQEKDFSHIYQPIGTNISSDPGQFFRFLSVNINGFDSHGLSQDVENILKLCQKNNAHYIGFCEANVDFTTASVRHTVSTTAKNCEPTIKSCLTSSDIRTGSIYKPGGIATFVRDKGFHRCSKLSPDPWKMGRYTVGIISGNGTSSIAAITVYQCGRGA